MLVYGHHTHRVLLPPFLDGLRWRLQALQWAPSYDGMIDVLVDLAEVASAVEDALNPVEDDERGGAAPWGAALRAVTDAFCAWCASDRRGVDAALARGVVLAGRLHGTGAVQARRAEGFACYALYPEQYIDAVKHWRLPAGAPVVCIGLRSIGAVLASVVASQLARCGHDAQVRSVRPRGHPFDRELRLGPALTTFLASRAHGHVAIVDEGPGISGSSFAAAAEAVCRLGVPVERITLMTAWTPSATSLRSSRAQRVFTTHHVLSGASPLRARAADALGRPPVNVSGGGWRLMVFGPAATRWPAVHPQHERVKYVDQQPAPDRIVRFAGLGRHGRDRRCRAEQLWAGGFGAEPTLLRAGLLVQRWVPGTPLDPRTPLTAAALCRIGDYIAFTARAFATSDTDDGGGLIEMLRHNSTQTLGAAARHRLDSIIDTRLRFGAPAVAVDGRMLTHEWVASGGGPLMKMDALDHHADDFLPGCRDIAWDVAGACVELRLRRDARRHLVDAYIARTRDCDIVHRLPFFTAAYLAWRLGYATLAAESLAGTPDGTRFTRLATRYRRALAAHLVAASPTRRY